MMERIVRKHSLSLILCCLSPAIAGPAAGWIEPQAISAVASARVKLNFTAESEKFDAATEEYRGIGPRKEGSARAVFAAAGEGLRVITADIEFGGEAVARVDGGVGSGAALIGCCDIGAAALYVCLRPR